ncbi:hypothetical protein OIN59_22215 [Acidovorax sp. D2M1]|uniref:Uncharacterized protein n=1 Tax=Acidovorax benzenivorans TaxID=2987520 RepID=A0ABT5S2K5_9BURK|nr:hypothetical protein [Acidovorax benzenivorans]MDD2180162.1 hypothetical protein [Acidovorax benzenivorans]
MADLFSEYVPPHILKQLAHPPAPEGRLSRGPVEFIFVMAQGHGDHDTAELIGVIAADASHAGWMVQALLCNLVVLVRGTVPQRESQVLERTALVRQLLGTYAPRIKAVHGAEQASFGNIGSSARRTHGVLLPSFSDAMGQLLSLPLGQSHDLGGCEAAAQEPAPRAGRSPR